jgi:hypothetical protein
VVAEEDSQAVASGAAAEVHSSLSAPGSWLQLHSFVYLCDRCGSSVRTSLTTKGTKVHKGKTFRI